MDAHATVFQPTKIGREANRIIAQSGITGGFWKLIEAKQCTRYPAWALLHKPTHEAKGKRFAHIVMMAGDRDGYYFLGE